MDRARVVGLWWVQLCSCCGDGSDDFQVVYTSDWKPEADVVSFFVVVFLIHLSLRAEICNHYKLISAIILGNSLAAV